MGAPISPLLYDQFIEHLGRCIYGGLWAELLEDRKLFYPVTGEAPAWEMFRPGGLGVAAGLHELFRDSDVFAMANYAQTVNVIGAIKTSGHAAELEATGLALALYRRHFGALPVAVSGAPAPLDVAAAWTADRAKVTVAVVNPDPSRTRRLALDVRGARLLGPGRRFVLTGAGPRAYNALATRAASRSWTARSPNRPTRSTCRR